ncbi:MAG TPA: LLM class flavin-dependent oxidoreductase [Solirubrobacteraceae bacterium]|jgi:alkanesulfonate monooxygenase SsuD/methylene tetrahydromethanopterin reductase-like flavin-dependent oxidoreductase (luciferase family)
MDIGIGLPNAVPGTRGQDLLNWARAAEEAGFSTLGTIDRIVYPNYEPLTVLSAAAAVTDRIRLATTVMLGPLRENAALVAKQALSLDALAGGGRVVLGIGLGGREDDYAVSGVSLAGRGAWQDRALDEIRRIWSGDGETESKIGPRPQGAGPSLIVGGAVDATFERAAKWGDGWIMGGGAPDQFTQGAEKLAEAWEGAGRSGEPRTMALAYFSLGPDAEQNANAYLRDYYGWLGDDLSGMIAGSAAKDADTIRGYLAAFEGAGCDELVIFPCSHEPRQVQMLAEAAGL